MKYSISLFLVVMLLVGCRNNKEEKTTLTPISTEAAFDGLIDTMATLDLKKSKIVLPFLKTIYRSKFKPDTLLLGLKGMDKYTCGKNFLRYIPFPDKGDVKLIVVPMFCDGYKYRYTMLSILNDSIIDNLVIEDEKIYSKDNQQITSFEISKNYEISTTILNQKRNSMNFEYNKYLIAENGKFVLQTDNDTIIANKCFSKMSKIQFPITSDHFFDLNYSPLTCSSIEGMKTYDCHDGINYITLKKTESGIYYVLIFTECGDTSYGDLVVVKNNRVISGLTIDTAIYDGESDSDYSGEETTFVINSDFLIELTQRKIKKGQVVSNLIETYKIDEGGRVVKIKYN